MPGGQISFWHKSDGGGYSGATKWVDYDIVTEFYIDNVLQETLHDEVWTIHSYSVTTGDHKFKWINKGGGYSNNITYIDYVICPK